MRVVGGVSLVLYLVCVIVLITLSLRSLVDRFQGPYAPRSLCNPCGLEFRRSGGFNR